MTEANDSAAIAEIVEALNRRGAKLLSLRYLATAGLRGTWECTWVVGDDEDGWYEPTLDALAHVVIRLLKEPTS